MNKKRKKNGNKEVTEGNNSCRGTRNDLENDTKCASGSRFLLQWPGGGTDLKKRGKTVDTQKESVSREEEV